MITDPATAYSLLLVGVGVGMIVAECFFPAFGSLGLGGLVAFVVGSLILFDSDRAAGNVALALIAAVATVGGLIVGTIVWLAARARGKPVVTGVQGMVGETAEAFESFTGKGRVRYGGEIWNARGTASINAGQIVRIQKVDGLTLWVEPI